jgi:hypothetical protein
VRRNFQHLAKANGQPMKNLAACLIVIVGSATSACGQWTIDATAGYVAQTSSSGFRPGLDLMGAVEQRLVAKLPFVLRLELGWNRNITRTDLDLVFDPPLLRTRLRPYVLGGFGLYKINVFGSNQTNFGFNLGGGLRYPIGPVEPFVEVRYHVDYAPVSAITFIPFQFGARIPFQ